MLFVTVGTVVRRYIMATYEIKHKVQRERVEAFLVRNPTKAAELLGSAPSPAFVVVDGQGLVARVLSEKEFKVEYSPVRRKAKKKVAV
jgi:hypothetical protein